mgnify:CR=1 FL=1
MPEFIRFIPLFRFVLKCLLCLFFLRLNLNKLGSPDLLQTNLLHKSQ